MLSFLENYGKPDIRSTQVEPRQGIILWWVMLAFWLIATGVDVVIAVQRGQSPLHHFRGWAPFFWLVICVTNLSVYYAALRRQRNAERDETLPTPAA